jgi:hypothetical protein
MNEVLYCLPGSDKFTKAFLLYEEEGLALLFVPPENGRKASLTIADRQNGDAVYENSATNSFPLKGWGTVATITIFLAVIMKENLIEKPQNLNNV